MTSPRAWAFGLLGIHEYLRRFSGDRLAGQTRDALTALLVGLHERTATPDWPWFEEILSYDNARLPHALIAGGPRRRRRAGPGDRPARPGLAWSRSSGPPRATSGRSAATAFLPQGARAGPVRPAADRGQRDGRRLPGGVPGHPGPPLVETRPRSAFEWFLGRNDLGQGLYDPVHRRCCDGLQEGRVNRNQGAESTLAFLLSLAEMNLLESSWRHSARRGRVLPIRGMGRTPSTRSPDPHMDVKRTGIVLKPSNSPRRHQAVRGREREPGPRRSSRGSRPSPSRKSRPCWKRVMREFRERHSGPANSSCTASIRSGATC